MIQAVIFDLDGTLLNTLGDIAGAVNRALKRYNIPGYPDAAYKAMVGYGLKDVTRKAFENAPEKDHVELDTLYRDVLDEYRCSPADKTFPYPGIMKLLDNLTSMDLKLSILSNKEDPLVQIITRKFFPQDMFAVIHGQLPEVPAKPDPEAVYSICTAMRVDRFDTVFIGDSGADMQTAQNAGITGIGVSWGYRDSRHLQEEGAGYIAFSPEDIIKYIKGEKT